MNFYKISSLILLVHSLNICSSQSLTPEVISSTGAFFSNGTNQLSWTLGEPVIHTESAGNYTLTQGFHQTLLSANPVNFIGDYDIKVFPNPTRELLQISIDSAPDDFQFDLYDIVGRKIKNSIINQSNITQISLAELSAGNYLLKITDKDHRLIQTFKVQKLR
jgi:hypothetical protein